MYFSTKGGHQVKQFFTSPAQRLLASDAVKKSLLIINQKTNAWLLDGRYLRIKLLWEKYSQKQTVVGFISPHLDIMLNT